MDVTRIRPEWPNALRWFLSQQLIRFAPWHFIIEPSQMDFAAKAFEREDVSRGRVFVFAQRQDCDDFAGLEIVGGKIIDRVIYFHPVFTNSASESARTWNIVCGTFNDVFDFVSNRVIPDMKEWALTADASEL